MKVKPRKLLIAELDRVFSQYIRLKDAQDGIAECFTCGKRDHWKKLQAGHFMSRRHYSTRWEEDNVKVQCYGCNVGNQGLQYVFGKKLGDKAEELFLRSRDVVKFSDQDLMEKIEYYKEKVKGLS